MSYKSLQEFINRLEKAGELKRISAPVSPRLEITEIADRVMKSEGGGKALLFENPVGSRMPLLINAFGSFKRMSWALGVEDIEEIAARIREIIALPQTLASTPGFFSKLQALPQLAKLADSFPKTVSRGECHEVVYKGSDVDLGILPVLTCWPQDGGPFITLPCVFTRDPITGARNVGMYRMQVFDRNTTGMHWQVHKTGARHYDEYLKRGGKIPVAVSLGGDPAITYAATAPLPEGIDEMLFAGWLRGKPVEMVKCLTNDLEVPADSEIVLEGYVDPKEQPKREGPFGDHTGYYSLADNYPVFHVTAITHRKNPVYPATIVGRPPMEDAYMGKASERIFLPLLQLQLPEIADINLPIEGVFHNLVIVSINKRYPGQARKVASALWGLGQMMLAKTIIIVDAEVNVRDYRELLWRVSNNISPRRDVFFTKGPIDSLDHASPSPNYGSKMGIDATKKLTGEGFAREWPEVIEMDKVTKQKVDELWKSLGL
jgi:4-hydroxy-3-polyprenylbenzoate decarboxylase